MVDVPGVSNDYINGAYPGRETVAPADIGALDVRSQKKDGDFDSLARDTKTTAIRTDVGTGIPTLMKYYQPSQYIPALGKERPETTLHFRPDSWSEDKGMREVLVYENPPGTAPGSKYIKMVADGSNQAFYMRIDQFGDAGGTREGLLGTVRS